MSPQTTSHRQPHDDPDQFREALNITTARTGYDPRLIEKDYYCTVLLEYLAAADPSLVFKGGTCLAKVHATFYRLSEDLDFSIPLPHDATRGERRRAAEKFKAAMASLADRIPILQIVQPCKGANNSTQYAAVVAYQSLATGAADTIKIEARAARTAPDAGHCWRGPDAAARSGHRTAAAQARAGELPIPA